MAKLSHQMEETVSKLNSEFILPWEMTGNIVKVNIIVSEILFKEKHIGLKRKCTST